MIDYDWLNCNFEYHNDKFGFFGKNFSFFGLIIESILDKNILPYVTLLREIFLNYFENS